MIQSRKFLRQELKRVKAKHDFVTPIHKASSDILYGIICVPDSKYCVM